MLEEVDVMAYIMEDSMVVIFVDIMVEWRLLDTIVDQCFLSCLCLFCFLCVFDFCCFVYSGGYSCWRW